MRTGRMKRGFTLIETVVTVGIVAAMAAVVIPQVAKQFDAADPTRIQNDLKNLQTAVETFNVNVKAMPGDLDDLANPILALEDTSLTVAATGLPTFTDPSQTGLWKGPYVDIAVANDISTDESMVSGFGARILDSFVCYNSTTDEHGVSEATGVNTADNLGCPNVAGQKFLAFQITGVTCSATAGTIFREINDLFDGTAETAAATQGRVRCMATAASTPLKDTDVDVVYFLAVPIS
jgi:prepilin-type N-terminal cleavage/methylation domain-containing protein